MKKIVSLLLAIVMVMLLAGCSFVILPEEDEDSNRKFEVYHAEIDYTV